ncbi:glycosyltransferase [Candidatus Gracilibacteria bacterium]|nr:glycosyltransferase [Candidatus Gracilibacteria bacterium]
MHISYFYDLPLPSPFAAPIQILQTCHALCRQGLSVTVYVNRLRASPEACLAYYGLSPLPGLQIVPWFGGLWQKIARGRALRAVLAAEQEQHIVMSRGETGIALFARLRGHIKRPQQRYVYEAHRLCFSEATRLRWRVRHHEQYAVESADGLVCLTEGVTAALRREFNVHAPLLVLPSASAVPAQAPADDTARDIDIIYAGKLDRRKGVYDLLHALALLPGRRLWLVGGTVAQVSTLKQHAEQIGVAERVIFTGYLAPDALPSLYRRARVGTCPLPVGESAIAEQFTSPLKVVEMMAYGVPIVGSDLPTLQAILCHEQTALLTPPSDAPALAAAIARLLDDRFLAQRLAQAAYQHSHNFSWERRAQRLRAFLCDL